MDTPYDVNQSECTLLQYSQFIGQRTEFTLWLGKNMPIWREFVELTRMVRERGREHWSARAILHVLRWNRVVRDATDLTYKINNNWSAEMARLYNRYYGIEFFRERDQAA